MATRSLAGPLAAMPSRKSEASPASASVSDKSNNLSPADITALPRPEVQVRRSSRRVAVKSADEDENKSREIEGKILGIRPKAGDEADLGDMAERKRVAKEGVQMAIEGLARMERRLQRANKRQKMKVEETIFLDPRKAKTHSEDEGGKESLREEAMDQAALEPAEPLKHPQLRSSENKTFEDKTFDEGGEEANRAQIKHELEEPPDAPERGAARPPPVNSGYLPLPWKGRLGYVSYLPVMLSWI